MYWGYHLILDCKSGNLSKIKSGSNITEFVRALVPGIGMVAYGDPTVEHFATHIPEAAGYSLVQLIETSSITGHFVDINGDCYIDVFSCKEFDVDIAKGFVQEYFEPIQMRTTYLTRQA
jgi:S-adenosylmethionine/arginine decarboxylase-like enzyme